jgi:hypothetical protein
VTEIMSHSVSHEMAAPERLRRMMMQVCPFRVGHRVTVSPTFKYAADYPGEYVIVGMVWEYQHGDGHDVNIWISSDEEIIRRDGSTDGFSANDLLPVFTHTHSFDEDISRAVVGGEGGTTKRCRCGARLWEPTAGQIKQLNTLQRPENSNG